MRYDRYGDEIEDAASAVVLTTVRISRISRTCATCQDEIRPGEQYARHFLPPDADHAESMTIIEHVSAGICYTVMCRD